MRLYLPSFRTRISGTRIARALIPALLITLITGVSAHASSGDFQWTWVSGDSNGSGSRENGVQGQFASGNTPGPRYQPSTATDASGNMWLYGGNQNNSHTAFADLWEWNGSQWAWIGGSASGNDQSASYGVLNTPDPANTPGARSLASVWVDSSGSFRLFGGCDGSEPSHTYNDMWKWNGTAWAWVGGANSPGSAGVHGIKGQADPANIPGARCGQATVRDSQGNIWVFGGDSLSDDSKAGFLNDLWKWNGASWTWVAGPNAAGVAGSYGQLGVTNPTNLPPGRSMAALWPDRSGGLWLFGGLGGLGTQGYDYLNDLWHFDGTNWTWFAGSSTPSQLSNFGLQGVAAPSNAPGGRMGPAYWADSAGNLWMFGGFGAINAPSTRDMLSDLWKWDGTEWTWMGGSNTLTHTNGVYGSPGVSSPNYYPSGRYEAGVWRDAAGAFWLFGGNGYPSQGVSIAPNLADVWKLEVPAPTTPTPPDLVVSSLTGPTSNVLPGLNKTYTVTVANLGDADVGTPFPLTLWASDHVITDASPLMPSSFASETGVFKLATVTVPSSVSSPIPAAGGSVAVTITGSFPAALPGGAPYYLYAVADSYDTAPPPGSVLGAVDEADITNGSPYLAQEQNNVSAPLQVTVTALADLATRISVDHPTHLTGDRAVYTVTVQNNGPADTTASPSIVMTTDIQSLVASGKVALRDGLGEPPVASSGTFSEATGVWSVGPLAAGATATLSIPVTILATGNGTNIALHITSYSLADAGITDPDATNNPMACMAPPGVDNCRTGTITVKNISLTPTSHDFGSRAQNTTSSPFTFTLTNEGAVDLTGIAIGVTGDFAMTSSDCLSPLAAGGSCSIAVTFTPTTAGLRQGSLNVLTEGVLDPVTADLTGLGTLPPPMLLMPRNGAAVYASSVKLAWKAVKGATGYLVEVFDDPQLTHRVDSGSPTTAFFQTTRPFGTYYWHVAAINGPGQGDFSLPYSFDVTLNKTPAKNGITASRLPKFAWQAVKGATGYHLQAYDSLSDCQNGTGTPKLDKDGLTAASYTMKSPDAPLGFGSYYWHVQSDAGVTTSWTTCWRFDVTTLKAPKNGSAVASFLPRFSWAANKAAAGYQVNFYSVPDGGPPSPLFSKPTTGPSYAAVAGDGFTYGHYQWNIQENLSGPGPNTPNWDFYITILAKPLNNTFTTDTTPTFSWKAIKGETEYTLQVADDAAFTVNVRPFDALAKTTYTLKPAEALGQGQYFWRVVATGAAAYTMPGWAFTVGP